MAIMFLSLSLAFHFNDNFSCFLQIANLITGVHPDYGLQEMLKCVSLFVMNLLHLHDVQENVVAAYIDFGLNWV